MEELTRNCTACTSNRSSRRLYMPKVRSVTLVIFILFAGWGSKAVLANPLLYGIGIGILEHYAIEAVDCAVNMIMERFWDKSRPDKEDLDAFKKDVYALRSKIRKVEDELWERKNSNEVFTHEVQKKIQEVERKLTKAKNSWIFLDEKLKGMEKRIRILEGKAESQQKQLDETARRTGELEKHADFTDWRLDSQQEQLDKTVTRTGELEDHVDFTDWILGGMGVAALAGAAVALGGGGEDDDNSAASADSAATGSSSGLSRSQSLTVSAGNSSWTSSGISFSAGQAISIGASGCAKNDPTFSCLGPDGRGAPDDTYSLPAPGMNKLSLVGKIGSTTFNVGSSYTGSAPASGILSFIYNDSIGTFGNNSGSFQVVVQY